MSSKLVMMYLLAMIGIITASMFSTSVTQVKVLLSIPIIVSVVFLAYIISQWRKQ